MNVYGTQMHLVTFIFICLETVLLLVQTGRYFWRLADKHRGRYSLLLLLLIVYDFTRGIFPDPQWPLSISLQHMISYGAGFLTASYFPFYFYKEFDLRALRWHSVIGVPLFLLLPYLFFFVLLYAVNDNFVADARMGIVIPFIYAIVLLRAIFLAIRQHYKKNRDRHFYIEEITVYCAAFPWVALGVFVWFQMGQVTEILCTNVGFVVITVLFFVKSARRARAEHEDGKQANRRNFRTAAFEERARLLKLTKREIEVALLLRLGLTYRQIALRLFIAPITAKNHIRHIYAKAGVNSKIALFDKLFGTDLPLS